MTARPAMSALARLALRQPSVRRASREERRIALRQRLRTLRTLEREVARLRVILADFLEEAEKAALGNYPSGLFWPGDPRQKVRFNKILADYMTRGGSYPEVTRADLRRIKAARRALGLEPWWDKP